MERDKKGKGRAGVDGDSTSSPAASIPVSQSATQQADWTRDIDQSQLWGYSTGSAGYPQSMPSQVGDYRIFPGSFSEGGPHRQALESFNTSKDQYQAEFRTFPDHARSSSFPVGQPSNASTDARVASKNQSQGFPQTQPFSTQPWGNAFGFNNGFPAFGNTGETSTSVTLPQPPYQQAFNTSGWTNLAVGAPPPQHLATTAPTIDPGNLVSRPRLDLDLYSANQPQRFDSDPSPLLNSTQSPRSSNATNHTQSTEGTTDLVSLQSGPSFSAAYYTSPTLTSPTAKSRRRKSQADFDNEEVRLREEEKEEAMVQFDAGPNRGNKRERRKMQNRLAQKAFRARTKVLAGEETDRVTGLEELSREQGEQIERMSGLVNRLQIENKMLREAHSRIPSSSGQPQLADGVSEEGSSSPDQLQALQDQAAVADGAANYQNADSFGLTGSPWQHLVNLGSSRGNSAQPDGDARMNE